MRTEKNPTTGLTLAVLQTTVEFLLSDKEWQTDFCVLQGVVPPGVVVPLHSHPDREDFVVLSGEIEGLRQDTDGYKWISGKAGDYFHVPPNAPHAWRNTSSEPVVQLIFTTPRLGRFFQEAGKPITTAPQLLTPEALSNFITLCVKYNYWLASPEENAAVGIEMGL